MMPYSIASKVSPPKDTWLGERCALPNPSVPIINSIIPKTDTCPRIGLLSIVNGNNMQSGVQRNKAIIHFWNFTKKKKKFY